MGFWEDLHPYWSKSCISIMLLVLVVSFILLIVYIMNICSVALLGYYIIYCVVISYKSTGLKNVFISCI